jgi:hypothetical protein
MLGDVFHVVIMRQARRKLAVSFAAYSAKPAGRFFDERAEPLCGFQFANGTNGVQWHKIDFDRCKGAA